MIATSVTLYITKLNTTQKQTHKVWMVVLNVHQSTFPGLLTLVVGIFGTCSTKALEERHCNFVKNMQNIAFNIQSPLLALYQIQDCILMRALTALNRHVLGRPEEWGGGSLHYRQIFHLFF
jgi:hypothetical protein